MRPSTAIYLFIAGLLAGSCNKKSIVSVRGLDNITTSEEGGADNNGGESESPGANSSIARLAYTTSVLDLQVNDCGAVTIQALDAHNKAMTVADMTLYLSDGSSGGTFYSDSSCTSGNEITSTRMVNSSYVTVYYKKPAPGQITLSVMENPSQGWSNATQTGVINSNTVTQLVFTSAALNQTTNDCGAITVQAQDASNVPVTVFGIGVVLSGAGTGGAYYSDSACTAGNEMGTVTINNSNSTTFYYRKLTAGTPTLTAAENPSRSWTDASQNATVIAVISKIAFTSPALDKLTSDCTQINIETQNAGSAATNVTGSNKTIDLGAGTGGTFYSDSACTGGNEVTALTIAIGSSSGSAYYKNTTPGSITLTAAENPSAGWTDASLAAVINSSTITQLVYTTASLDQTTSDCGAIIVQARTGGGVPVTAYGISINLSSNAGGTFYSDAACTTGNEITTRTIDSTNSVTYYYKKTSAGTALLTADESPSKGWSAASQTATLNGTTTTKLVYTTSALAQDADDCGTITVQAQDSSNAAVTVYGVNVSLSDGAAGGNFYSDSSCTGGNEVTTRTINNADSVTYYYKKTSAGTPTLTAAESPSRSWSDASQNATITNIITKLAFSNTALDIDTNDCGALTIQTQDAGSSVTNVTGGNKTIDLGDGSAGGTFYSDSSCTGGNEVTTRAINNGSNAVNVYYKKTAAASVTLSAAENPNIGWTNASQAAIINSENVTKLAYTTSALAQKTSDCGAITLQTQDGSSVATNVYNITVNLADGGAGGTFYSDSSCTGGNEITTRTINSANSVTYYYKNTSPGSFSLTADEAPSKGWTLASQTAGVNSTSVTKLAYTTSALAQDTATCGTITVQAQNVGSGGVTVYGITVNLADGSDGVFYSDSSCTGGNEITTRSINNANAVTYYYKKATVGTPTITASESPDLSWTDASQNATITAVITKLAFSNTALNQNTDDCGALTIQSQDSGSTPTNVTGGNKTIDLGDGSAGGTFYSDSSCTGGNEVTTRTINSGSSSVAVYYKNTSAGTPTLTAAENPDIGWTNASQAATINSTSVTKLAYATSALDQTTAACGLITVQAQDSGSTPVTVYGITVDLSDGAAGGVFYSDSSCTGGNEITTRTINSANSVSYYYKKTVTAAVTITADENPSRGWTAASQTGAINSTVITKLAYTTGALNQNNTVCGTITVQIQDSSSMAVTAYGVTVDLSDGAAGGTFYSDSSCTGGNEITTRTINNAQSVTYYYKKTTAGTPTLTAAENPDKGWTDASQNATITAGSPPASGPGNLATSSYTDVEVSLTWDSVATATSYKVERASYSGSCGAYSQISNPSVTSLDDTGRSSVTTYCYRVRASNAYGDGPYSSELQVTTKISAPASIGATAAVTATNVTWGSVSGADSYTIFWSTSSGVTTSSSAITNATATYNHTGRTGGQAYYYRVAAVKTGVTGVLSSEASAVAYIGAVADPTFSVAAGSYSSVQSVSLSTTTGGASIRYTTDGSTPTSSSGTVYSSTITVATTQTVKAIAYLTNYQDSNVTSAAYTITIPPVNILFMEPGSDATNDSSFYYTPMGVTSVSDQVFTGPRSFSGTNGQLSISSFMGMGPGLGGAKSRISYRMRFSQLPASASPIANISSTTSIRLAVLSDGKVRLQNDAGSTIYATSASALLSANSWYRIAIAYSFTSATVNSLKVFVDNGTTTTTAINLTNTNYENGTSFTDLYLYLLPAVGTTWYDDVYVDDGDTVTDPGNIRITVKRPSGTTNTTNAFDTTIGTTTNRWDRVNEVPMSETLGLQDATANSPGALETFNIQAASAGDVNITGATIVGSNGWVRAKKGSGTATTQAQLVLDGAETQITLTTSSALYRVFSNASTYPGDNAIGLRAINGTADTFLYEAGVLLGFIN